MNRNINIQQHLLIVMELWQLCCEVAAVMIKECCVRVWYFSSSGGCRSLLQCQRFRHQTLDKSRFPSLRCWRRRVDKRISDVPFPLAFFSSLSWMHVSSTVSFLSSIWIIITRCTNSLFLSSSILWNSCILKVLLCWYGSFHGDNERWHPCLWFLLSLAAGSMAQIHYAPRINIISEKNGSSSILQNITDDNWAKTGNSRGCEKSHRRPRKKKSVQCRNTATTSTILLHYTFQHVRTCQYSDRQRHFLYLPLRCLGCGGVKVSTSHSWM